MFTSGHSEVRLTGENKRGIIIVRQCISRRFEQLVLVLRLFVWLAPALSKADTTERVGARALTITTMCHIKQVQLQPAPTLEPSDRRPDLVHVAAFTNNADAKSSSSSKTMGQSQDLAGPVRIRVTALEYF